METGASEEGKWVLQRDDEEATEHVDDLQDRDGLDDGIQRDGEEVEEEFRPEEGVEGCPCLVCRGLSVTFCFASHDG